MRAYNSKSEDVRINKEFVYLYDGEYMRARTIFKERGSVNAIPVVTEDHILLGDYTRWDDLKILDYELDIAENNVSICKDGQSIVLVRPGSFFIERERIFERFHKYLKMQNITVRIINGSEIVHNMEVADRILFVDENENRAWATITKIVYGENFGGKDRTYRDILGYHSFMVHRYNAYFNMLCEKGIHFLGLVFEKSVYYEELLKKISDKNAGVGNAPFLEWPKSMHKQFFGELYNEEYADQIWNMPFRVENLAGVRKLKDCQSRFYNVIHGERRTDDQPKTYVRSIYFFGPCYIFGRLVEDKNTIESYLQRQLRDNGIPVKVVNCGSFDQTVHGYFTHIVATQLKKENIVVVSQPGTDINRDDMTYLDLNCVLEKNHVGPEWLTNESRHCNHKVNKLYAEAIYEALEPILSENIKCEGMVIEKEENYIKFLYLDRYFIDFTPSDYVSIGSVVMNCNPFTYGHRHLIEYALNIVDYLVIFVVEENKSIFSFEERFTMVREGVRDLKNVRVVPSGPYILSQASFPEYFRKQTSEDIVEHTEQDITTFAEKIAPQIGIKYRFVGEEPDDEVTRQYNLAMKTILPRYGIELVEIPRKKENEQYISASLARTYMEQGNGDKIEKLVPHTTREIVSGGRH